MELIPCRSAIDYIRCGYEVPGMILFLYLKGAKQLDRSKDMPVPFFNSQQLRLQSINTNCMAVVVLIRCACF
jgi:hypothetical protein